ncbi:MAG: EpsG family protein [Paludibacteraceae bacterium]|nr:EpsG family protein [Paludibacteraceae bacterium]
MMNEITRQTVPLVFLSLLIFLVIYLLLKPVFKGKQITRTKLYCSYVFLFCFTFFSFYNTDWFHYQSVFNAVKVGFPVHLEMVYVWLIETVCNDYLTFRVIVWGAALILTLLLLKKASISYDLALFFFGTIWIIWFSYARVSLAMAMVFLGGVLLASEREPFLMKILGFFLLIFSFYFHKSAAFGIVVVVVALMLKYVKMNVIPFLFILFPILLFVIQFCLGDFLSADIDEEGDTMNSYMSVGQHYMARTGGERGIAANIQRLLERTPYYFLSYMIYKKYRNGGIKRVPSDVRFFMNVLFLIVYGSSLFFFDFGANLETIYGRFLRYSFIPATIVLTYFYEHEHYRGTSKSIYKLAAFGTVYTLLYSFYITIVT